MFKTMHKLQIMIGAVAVSMVGSSCFALTMKSAPDMGLFKKKSIVKSYDKENKRPVIKASICNGEQVAGFKDIHTGKIEEVMLIRSQADLENFKAMYGIDEAITKEY